MTRVDLQTRLQNFFQNGTYYTTDDLNNCIQDGMDEVAAFTGCIYASATISFIPGKTYYDLLTLLPNYIGVIAIYNATINRWLIPTSIRKLDQVRIDWETCGGTPYYFVPVNHRYVALYYKPLAAGYGNMYIFYRASAPVLTDTLAIPIPDDHIQALESYCIEDLWEMQQEWGKAGEYFEIYDKNIEELRLYMRTLRNPARQMGLK